MKIKCGKYKHYKGKKYTVYGVASSLYNEKFVLYQKNYDDKSFWIRPITMFLEMVNEEDKMVPRFRLLAEVSPEESITTLIDELKKQSILILHSETEQKFKVFNIDTVSKEIIVTPYESISPYLTDTQLAWRMGYDLYKIDGIKYVYFSKFPISASKKLIISPKNDLDDLDVEHENKKIIEDINACSIDLHISDRFFSKPKRKTIDIASMMHFSVKGSELWKEIHPKKINGFEAIAIRPGQTIITHTLEKIELPADCAGKIEIKSTYARLALTITASDFCNPGWKGYFPLTITNNSRHKIILHPKEKMLQLSLVQTDGHIINEYSQKSTYMNDDGTPFKFWYAQTIKHLQKVRYSDEILEFYKKVLISINYDNSENIDDTKSRFEDTFLLFCEKKLKSEKYNTMRDPKQLLKKIWDKYRKSESAKRVLLGKFFKILTAVITFVPSVVVACIDMFVDKQLSWSLLIWFLISLVGAIVLEVFLHIITPKCFCTFEKMEFDSIYRMKKK